MSIRRWVLLGAAWVVSLVAVGTAASAQAPLWRPVPQPRVMFGDDVGFRVEGLRGETPTGTLVIRVNGVWMEAHVGGPKEGLIR